VRIRAWGQTDVGRVRNENQDTFLVADLSAEGEGGGLRLEPGSDHPGGEGALGFSLGPRGAVLLVADGMGGPAGGGRASQLTRMTVARAMEGEGGPRTPEGFVAELRRAVEEANLRVRQEASGDHTLTGMGTTLTLAGLLDGQLFLVQVGDSRGYLFRNGELVQLTRDQSVVQELLDHGAISEAQARTSPQRHVLLQALGTSPEVNPVVTAHELRREDLLLLCSDGLSGPLSPDTISRILEEPGSLRDRSAALVDAANAAGGQDNITVVLARVEGEDLRPPSGEV